jgi:hypothetical protein
VKLLEQVRHVARVKHFSYEGVGLPNSSRRQPIGAPIDLFLSYWINSLPPFVTLVMCLAFPFHPESHHERTT